MSGEVANGYVKRGEVAMICVYGVVGVARREVNALVFGGETPAMMDLGL